MAVSDALGHKGSAFASPATFLKACSCADDGYHVSTCIESRKGKILPKGDKCELVDYNSLPNYMKDNQFILCYYRAEWPLKQTIFSIFSLHNETLNIWTNPNFFLVGQIFILLTTTMEHLLVARHLIGFFLFLALMTCAAMMLQSTCYADTDHSPGTPGVSNLHLLPQNTPPSLPSEPNASNLSNWDGHAETSPPCTTFLRPQFFPCHYLHSVATCSAAASSTVSNHTEGGEKEETAAVKAEPAPRWPFFTYLCGAMACLLVSSACHLLSCHSQKFLYVMRGLDYTGITVLIVTSFYPVVYYSFICDAMYRHLYLGLITISGLAMAGVSLVPSFQGPKHRTLRAGLFFCMGISGVVPIMHKVVRFRDRQAARVTTGYEAAMGTLYVLATAVYTARVPERWMPGRFDLLGQSHHFFHVLVTAAAYTHYLGALVYLKWRDLEGC